MSEDKRLYPRASPLSKALRDIAKGTRLSSLQVPVLEDAASHIEDLEDRLRDLANTVEQVMPDMWVAWKAIMDWRDTQNIELTEAPLIRPDGPD